jgi:putative tricarboxylic transport membrane protein
MKRPRGWQEEMDMKRSELIEGALIFLCGGITVVLSLQMPIGTFRMAGSGLFPLFLGMALMLLALLYLVNLLFQKDAERQSPKAAAGSPGATGQMLLFLGASVFATLCLGFLGYPAFCFLIMLFLLRILGIRRPTFLLGLSLLTAAGAYLLFVWFLKIPLPKGLIGL